MAWRTWANKPSAAHTDRHKTSSVRRKFPVTCPSIRGWSFGCGPPKPPRWARKESSMADLLPTTTQAVGTSTVPTVNARDLYLFLGLHEPFRHWIQRSLKRANLLPDVDYVFAVGSSYNRRGGRPAHEYHLT